MSFLTKLGAKIKDETRIRPGVKLPGDPSSSVFSSEVNQPRSSVEGIYRKQRPFGMPLATARQKQGILDSDIHFLMRSSLVRMTPERLKRSLLSALTRMTFPAGYRIISQGNEGDSLFILQRGSCEVNLEKNNELHVVDHLKPGDVFGELAVITGDCRSANVDTLTEVVAWSLEKEKFEHIVQSCREVTEFLTDLATERLCSRKITAEKNIGRNRITDVLAEGGGASSTRVFIPS